MRYRFETSHDLERITLTLVEVDTHAPVWNGSFERYAAQMFVDMIRSAFGLYDGSVMEHIHAGNYVIGVMPEGAAGMVIMIGDSGPYLKHKVLLNRNQALDLASTVQIHIFESESDGRPRDLLPPADDVIDNGPWTPEKEKRMYGPEGPEDNDPADAWKHPKN